MGGRCVDAVSSLLERFVLGHPPINWGYVLAVLLGHSSFQHRYSQRPAKPSSGETGDFNAELQEMAPLPNFTSIHQVLPYLNNHRNNLSMVDIINACDWALDPGFIQRDAIAKFVHALPRAQQPQLVDNEQQQARQDEQPQLGQDECPLCCRPYGAGSGAHFSVILPCGHVVGVTCLKEFLKDTEACFDCGATVFKIPAATTTFTNPGHEGILRGFLQSGGVFVEEKMSVLGSDKSYAAFFRWAHGHSTDHDSIIARLHARETIGNLDIPR